MLTRLAGSTLVAVLVFAGSLAGALTHDAPRSSTAVVPLATHPVAATSTSSDAYEARILTLVNRQRLNRDLPALRPLPCADRYAQAWAAHMARNRTMYHQSLAPIVRSCSAGRAGENIAYGNVSADRMMSTWMASRGHRANILDKTFTHIGIGAARTPSGHWYGAQNFAGR